MLLRKYQEECTRIWCEIMLSGILLRDITTWKHVGWQILYGITTPSLTVSTQSVHAFIISTNNKVCTYEIRCDGKKIIPNVSSSVGPQVVTNELLDCRYHRLQLWFFVGMCFSTIFKIVMLATLFSVNKFRICTYSPFHYFSGWCSSTLGQWYNKVSGSIVLHCYVLKPVFVRCALGHNLVCAFIMLRLREFWYFNNDLVPFSYSWWGIIKSFDRFFGVWGRRYIFDGTPERSRSWYHQEHVPAVLFQCNVFP